MVDNGLLRSKTSSFVNRVRELTELCAGVHDTLAGQGRLFTVAGEPGIGKSRLADEAANYAVSKHMSVLWGRCWEGGGAPAYWPWIQVIRALASSTQSSIVVNWLSSDVAEVFQIVPELRALVPDLSELSPGSLSEPEQARFRLFDSVVRFFRRASEHKPILAILDDLHAADPTSLLMLLALARAVRGAGLMIVGIYRKAEVRNSVERAALIAEIEREGILLPLRGLAEAEIGEFIERTAGISPTPSLVSLLETATEGNPFFLSEILRLMAAEGHLATDPAIVSHPLQIPDGVRASIMRRIQPLSDETRQTLTVASVIGREFDLNCLAMTRDVPRERIVDALDTAIRLELVTGLEGFAGRYTFRHMLIRDALYGTLPTNSRVKLHRLVGDAIRSLDDSDGRSGEIAYHYSEAAVAGNADLAVQYSRRAAQIATQKLAYEESSRYLSTALQLLPFTSHPSEQLKADLLLELGEAQTRAGRVTEARKTCLEAADRAKRLANFDLFARAVVTAGRAISDSGVTDSALVALLTEALEVLEEADSPVRAQVLARLGVELYWSERDRGTHLCQKAVDIARRLGDRHTLILVLWAHHLSLRNPDSIQDRLADTSDIIRTAESAGERDFAQEARFYRISDLIEIGNVLEADLESQTYLRVEEQTKDPFKRGLLLRGMRALLDGRFEEAEHLAQQALVAGQESGRPLSFNSFLIQTGHVLWEQARLREFEPSLRAYIDRNPLILFAQCALVQCLIQGGKASDARAVFNTLAVNNFSTIPRDWNWLPSIFVLADVCVDLGARAEAEILYEILRPYASRNAVLGYVYCYGSVSYALARLANILGRVDESAVHFEDAIAANRRLRANTWVAHSECEYAALLLKRNTSSDRRRAFELLESVHKATDTFRSMRLQEKLQAIRLEVETAQASPGLIGDNRQNRFIERPGDSATRLSQDNVPGTITKSCPAIDAIADIAAENTHKLATHVPLDGTVTILFSDMQNSTGMFEHLGDLRAQEIIRLHNAIIRKEVSAHQGIEIKSMGDGFMVAFAGARRGVLCAIAIQRAFADHCEKHRDVAIRVRIGLHTGEPINEATDLFGKAVILAARIAATAGAGEILVSSTLRDLVEGAGDIRFADSKEISLKGLAGTHRVYPVIW